jgi:hypothetical protein
MKDRNNETEKHLLEIGRSIIRVMMYQAEVRLSGAYDMRKDNQAYAEMLMATRSAGKLLRGLAADAAKGDDIARLQLTNLLLTMDWREYTGIINTMNDGHLSLTIQSREEI